MSKKVAKDHSTQVTDDCPVERAIVAFAGKLKMLVLRSLLLNGSQRYNQLLRTVRDISPKELTQNLRQLEREGFALRHATAPHTAHYELTALGSMLLPPFQALAAVGEQLRAP